MSTRWMMVQYVGNTLRLPIVNEGNMERPFGSSVLERDVQRIVVNPFSDNPHTFVLESELKDAEAENAKLRELVKAMEPFLCCMPFASCNTLAANVRKRMRELGIEVDKCMGQQRTTYIPL